VLQVKVTEGVMVLPGTLLVEVVVLVKQAAMVPPTTAAILAVLVGPA
jgi:hypothetical protein